MNRVFCLDSSVLVSYLVPDEQEPQADTLVLEVVSGATRLVAPAFAWAEIGSVLQKKNQDGFAHDRASARLL